MLSTECVNEWCGDCSIGERGCSCDCHLTKRQAQVLNAVTTLTSEKGFPPTVRELAKALGLRSPCAVSYHVGKLSEAGRLHHEPGLPRTLRVIQPAGRPS